MPSMRQIGSLAEGGSCTPVELSLCKRMQCNQTSAAFPSGATRQDPSQRSDGGTERGLVTQRTGFVPVAPLNVGHDSAAPQPLVP